MFVLIVDLKGQKELEEEGHEEYPYTFTINDSNHEFTTEEIGGEIKFSNIVNIYDSQQLDEKAD